MGVLYLIFRIIVRIKPVYYVNLLLLFMFGTSPKSLVLDVLFGNFEMSANYLSLSSHRIHSSHCSLDTNIHQLFNCGIIPLGNIFIYR